MNRRLAALAITALALSAGCADDTDTVDAALTEEELVAQANAICAAGNAEIEALAAEAVSPRSEWNAGDWVDAAIVLAQGGFDLPEIRVTLAWAGRYTGVVVELGHPEAIARGWVTLLAEFRDGGKRVGE